MVAPAMNAVMRRSSALKISHVLSGSTRSLSSTSSPAARGCAARTAAFATSHTTNVLPRSSTILSTNNVFSALGKRAFSTGEPADASTAAAETAATDAQPEGEQERRAFRNQWNEDRPYGNRNAEPDREYPPSRTIFVGNLPFFCTEADVRDTFGAIAPIESLRFGIPKQTHNTPYAHITFEKLTDATAIYESAKQEPFFLEGRECRIGYAKGNVYGPTRLVYFDNFNEGDLSALREFLGPRARWVDNAWFVRDKNVPDKFKPNGLIQFHDVEQATTAIKELHMSPGPDGLPVYMRYARDDRAGGVQRKRVSPRAQDSGNGDRE